MSSLCIVGAKIESTYEDIGPPQSAESLSTRYTEIGGGKREAVSSDYEISDNEITEHEVSN